MMKQLGVTTGLALCLGISGQAEASPYAKVVSASQILNGSAGNTNNYTDTTKALGAPDSAFVSLGGPGGYVLLDMGASPIVDGSGPDIEVREMGTATGGVDEEYRVLISNSTDLSSFVQVSIGSAVSLLDIAGTGLSSARYVLLEDLSTKTNTAVSPGSDIDSVTSLHAAPSSLTPVTGLSASSTSNGVRLAWTPVTGTGVANYLVRWSPDGVRFDSNANDTRETFESAWLHVLGQPTFFPRAYAVSVKYTSGESPLQVVSVPHTTTDLALSAPAHGPENIPTLHLGDNSTLTGDWAPLASPGSAHTLTFTLAEAPRGPVVRLNLELYDVSNSSNRIIINGHSPRTLSLPVQSTTTWKAMSLVLESGLFKQGLNSIEFRSSGSNLDDFQIRAVSLTQLGL